MIFTLGLGLGGVFLATCVGLASVVVKVYSCAPPLLLIILRHLFDFLFAFTEACCRLSATVLLFLYNVLTHLLGTFISVVPGVFHVVSTLFSFLLWICVHLIRGLLGLEAKAMNTLSWLIAICALFLYIENKYQDVGVIFPFINRRPNFARVLNRHRRNNNDNDNEDYNHNNIVAADQGTDVDPEQQQENQLLEIENRENENEENALEEADRNRVNIDNVQNDQRELDRDRGERAPPVLLANDDSSDDEIDPMMCSVCLHRARGAALFPCGHTQLCRICARIIMAAQRPCPMCQTPIQESRNVYV